jgi:hypothetical protein
VQPLRAFDKAKARKLYLCAAISVGVVAGILVLGAAASDVLSYGMVPTIVLAVLALAILSSAYFLPRAIRVYLRSRRYFSIPRDRDGNPL